jgi:hypothetical protein
MSSERSSRTRGLELEPPIMASFPVTRFTTPQELLSLRTVSNHRMRNSTFTTHMMHMIIARNEIQTFVEKYSTAVIATSLSMHRL